MASEEVFIDDYAIEQTSDNLVVFISPSEPLPARPALYLPARRRRSKISLNGGSGDTGGGKHEII